MPKVIKEDKKGTPNYLVTFQSLLIKDHLTSNFIIVAE